MLGGLKLLLNQKKLQRIEEYSWINQTNERMYHLEAGLNILCGKDCNFKIDYANCIAASICMELAEPKNQISFTNFHD